MGRGTRTVVVVESWKEPAEAVSTAEGRHICQINWRLSPYKKTTHLRDKSTF